MIIRAKSGHALERAMQREVESAWVQDALQSPLHIRAVQWDDHNRPVSDLSERDATVNVNPETGTIVTVLAHGKRDTQKIREGRTIMTSEIKALLKKLGLPHSGRFI